jgi:hypothetical protein
MVSADMLKTDKLANRRLYPSVVALRNLYPHARKWNAEFTPRLSALMHGYTDSIELWHIGFPVDWEKQLNK